MIERLKNICTFIMTGTLTLAYIIGVASLFGLILHGCISVAELLIK
jgi:hypothetical protein